MTTEEILHLNLTDEQYAAVIDDSRNILCLACAGSGKSRTLAYKIAYLISKGEEPESIIAFTFTEKAAESIKRRVAEALRKFGLSENIVGAMFIGTLDAFCQKLLGDINAKYRQFDILDQNRLVLYVMSRQYKLGLKNGKGYFNRIKEFTDAWQTMHNENIDLKDIEKYDTELFNRLSCLSDSMSADGYMDFSFAIYLAVQELNKIEKKEGSYIEKFKYLFVNDAASYVQELTGEEANIIFGAMYDDTVADYCRITVIATGLNDDNLQQTPFGKRSTASSFGARRPSSTATTGTVTAGTAAGSGMNMPSFSLPTMNATPFGASKTPSSTVQKKDIQIPDFLRNR